MLMAIQVVNGTVTPGRYLDVKRETYFIFTYMVLAVRLVVDPDKPIYC
jgi:hypothetical protein